MFLQTMTDSATEGHLAPEVVTNYGTQEPAGKLLLRVQPKF